jgi:hypothetical protein
MIVGLVLSAASFAQTITFDVDEDRVQALGLDPQGLSRGLTGTAEVDLNLVDPDGYLARFARAAAVASKGMGVDYATQPKLFTVGAAVGSAVSGISPAYSRDEDELPESGFAAMASIHAGLNLGSFDKREQLLDRFRIYVSGLGFRAPNDFVFQAKMFNLGLHLQIDAMKPIDLGLARWGGIQFTGGYERSVYELVLSHDLPLSTRLEGAEATWSARGVYTIKTHADSLPLEISSAFQFAPLTVFGGLGVDFDFAASTASVSLSGPVTVDIDSSDEPLGTGTVALDGEGDSNGGQFRGFFGTQINIWAFKIYGQMNIGTDKTYGLFAGTRIAL